MTYISTREQSRNGGDTPLTLLIRTPNIPLNTNSNAFIAPEYDRVEPILSIKNRNVAKALTVNS